VDNYVYNLLLSQCITALEVHWMILIQFQVFYKPIVKQRFMLMF